MNWKRRLYGFLGLLGLAATLVIVWGSRQAWVVPPSSPDNRVTVYLVGYEMFASLAHNSLVFPQENGEFVEYSFGDRAVYAENRDGVASLARAVLYPTPGTLGRRRWEGDVVQQLREAAGFEVRLVTVQVGADSVRQLVARLDRRYENAIDNNATTPAYNPEVALYFVPDGDRYWAFNTCNHAVARWLEALGCQIRGSVFRGHFAISERSAFTWFSRPVSESPHRFSRATRLVSREIRLRWW